MSENKHHRELADAISRLFWDNFLKSEPALAMRDVIAIELDKATDRERERCAKLAEDVATYATNEDGELYIAKKIASQIRKVSR